MGVEEPTGFASVAWVRALINELKNSITNIGGGNVPNPLYYPTITHAALLASVNASTATNGFYYVTSRPTSGTAPLLVQVMNNGVSTLGWVVRTVSGVSYPHKITYYFANDIINMEWDTRGNVWNDLVVDFPYDDADVTNNDLSQSATSTFTGFTGVFSNNKIVGSIHVTGSDANVAGNTIGYGSSVDATALTNADLFSAWVIEGGITVTPATNDAQLGSGGYISNETSTYAKTFTIASNAISFQETTDRNRTGVVTVSSSATKLFTINGLAKAPKFFRLKNFRFDWADVGVTNVFVTPFVSTVWDLNSPGSTTIILSNEGYADCYTDGTSVWLITVNDM